VVRLERWFGDERIDDLEPGGRPERHPDGDGPVELHDR